MMTRFRSLDRPAYAVAATALSAIVLAGPTGAAALSRNADTVKFAAEASSS